MKIEDELLKVRLEEFSAYREEFIADTKHDDILMTILRVHMYIEKEMVELTNIYFKHPNVLKDLNFKSRLNLLFALGVIEKELNDPINVINKIRNDISHKLNYEFSEGDYEKIYNSLSKNILEEFKKDLNTANFIEGNLNYVEKTKLLLSTIWTSVKAEVLTSFIFKKELAKDYEEQAIKEVLEFKQSKSL